MDENVTFVSQGIHRKHILVGLLAGAFSFAIHAGLLYWLMSTAFEIALVRTPERDSDEYPTIRLRDVDLPEAVIEEPSRAAAEAAVRVADMSRTAQLLEIPTETPDLEPPDVTPDIDTKDATTMDGPERDVQPEAWQPRQEILAIEESIVLDEVAELPRRQIPKITRINEAADVVYPVDSSLLLAGGPDATVVEETADLVPSLIEEKTAADVPAAIDTALTVDETQAENAVEPFEETPEEVTEVAPLENFLAPSVVTYSDRRDPEYGYFRIEISRRDKEVLPVIPKDVLFVQDCSASMAEQRLYFCRQGLKRSLATLGPDDRFNVVGFRDGPSFGFESWATNTLDNRAVATAFIDAFRSKGSTDIYASIQRALTTTREPGRPVIAILITDGHATVGLRDASSIIREFSKHNEGEMSVFTLGTIQTADTYLLDLLSYCNRGDTRQVEGGRWSIPDMISGLADEVRNPVLSAVGLRVARATPAEVYPVQMMNLYEDRPLVLHGRHKRGLKQVTLQARGLASDTEGDMIFSLDLEGAPKGSKEFRSEFGRQKVYHLMGAFARSGDPRMREKIKNTARDYRVRIPHRGSF